MNNPAKKIRAVNTQTQETRYYTKEQFDTLKQNHGNYFWVFSGYNDPTDVVPCWYVTEAEKKQAVKDQKPFSETFSTNEYFKITKNIDSIHIEGYLGRNDRETSFHDFKDSSLSYFIDYYNRKKVYFTFDKISLYEVITVFPENPFRFILKRVDNLKSFKKNQAFMIMPFHNAMLDEFYFKSIKPFLMNKLGIEIYRADDFRDNDIIIQTIYTLIEESEFVIADTTYENKNAFYELGYASAIGKEIITIQDKSAQQKLFFDRAHVRSILYNVDEIESFQFDLDSTISSIRARF